MKPKLDSNNIYLTEANRFEEKAGNKIGIRQLVNRCRKGNYKTADTIKWGGRDIWFISKDELTPASRQIYEKEIAEIALQKNGSLLPIPSLNLPVEPAKSDEEKLPIEVPISEMPYVEAFEPLFIQLVEEVETAGKRNRLKTIKFRATQFNLGKWYPETLQEWGTRSGDWFRKTLKAYENSGCNPVSIMRRYDKRRESGGKIDPRVKLILAKYVADQNNYNSERIMDKLFTECKELKLPYNYSRSTLRLEIGRLKRSPIIIATRGESEIRKIVPTLQRDIDSIPPGVKCEVDGSPTNVWVNDPKSGERIRMVMVISVDFHSRYLYGIALGYGESTELYLSVAFQTVYDLGKPVLLWTFDNGSAAKSKATQSGIKQLGGKIQYCKVRTPTGKPIVEKFFDYWRDHQKDFHTNTGDSPLSKDKPSRYNPINKELAKTFKELDSYIITPEDLVGIAFKFREEYNSRVIKSGPLKGKKPKDIIDPYRGKGIDPKKLVYLMMQRKVKKVNKNGLQVDGKRYWSEQLINYIGTEVIFRFDSRWDERIYVFDGKTGDYLFEVPRFGERIHAAAGILGSENDIQKLQSSLRLINSAKNKLSEGGRFFNEKIVLPDKIKRAQQYGRKDNIQEVSYAEIKEKVLPENVNELLRLKTGTDGQVIVEADIKNIENKKPKRKYYFLSDGE